MNVKTAFSKTKELADGTSEAVPAPGANQAFFVVDTPPRVGEKGSGNKTKFLYDDDLAYLIE